MERVPTTKTTGLLNATTSQQKAAGASKQQRHVVRLEGQTIQGTR
jgi:hypothetical protein